MPNVSSFGAQTDNAVVSGTVTDRQMIIPEVPPQGLMSVGPRVTPHFVKPSIWSALTTYHFFDAVHDVAGASYVAIKPEVPAGTELTDEDYWFLWADPNSQFADLNELVKTFNGRISQNTADIATKAPHNHASEDTTYGVGNEVNYGHVRLATGATPLTSGADEGIAATPAFMENNTLVRTSSNFNDEISKAAADGRVFYASSIESNQTIVIPQDANVYIGKLTYTGAECAIKYVGGSNSKLVIGALKSASVGIDMSSNVYMDGGYIYIQNCTCTNECVKYAPTGDTLSWAQYLTIDGGLWESTGASCIYAKPVTAIPNKQWFNNIRVKNISFISSSPYYAIEGINRDYNATLFGIDGWYLDNISMEKCFKGLHFYSATGLKSANMRCEETKNDVLTVAGFMSDCEFNFSTFLKTNRGMPFITSNVEGYTCIVNAPIYATEINLKSNPTFTKCMCAKNTVIPLESPITSIAYTDQSVYNAPTDFTAPQPTAIQANSNTTYNFPAEFYNTHGIKTISFYSYESALTNCIVNIGSKATTITSAGAYVIAQSGALLKIS